MVVVCTPAKDVVQAGFAYDLVNLIKESPDTIFATSMGTLLPNQRTELVKGAIDRHISHVLFIDGDMRFPADTIKRLLKHNQYIIGANCRHRQADKWTTDISSNAKKGIEEVKKIGFGVTLIKTEVFMRLSQPWFATPYDGDKFIGEDVYFCYKAVEAGYKIFVDHDLSQDVKHTGTRDY